MLEIDKEVVMREICATGQALLVRFSTLTPVIERRDMMMAFRDHDGKASDAIRAALARETPGVGWLDGELKGSAAWTQAGEASFWVCDAIDGAVQYLRGIPQWCVSLTLLTGGVARMAFLYDPIHEEFFHAECGVGAFLNGRAISVNGRVTHCDGFLTTSQPPFVQNDAASIRRAARSMQAILPEAGAVRNLGPTSLQLAYVACGRLDGFWEFGEDTFNCLGGALMVAEAGGVATDAHGNAYVMQSDSIVAGPAAAHASLLRALQESDPQASAAA